MNDCIFCDIRDGKSPAKFMYQDDDVMVFPDIQPRSPIHWLIVPKKHIPELMFVEDEDVHKKLFSVVKKMIERADFKDKGYKIVINGGGLQDVNHLHIHLRGPILH